MYYGLLHCIVWLTNLLYLNDRKSKAIESHFVAPSVVLGQPFHSKKLSLIFFLSVNASRECGDDGSWNEITYYGDCLCNSTGQCETDDIGSMGSEISVIIYLIGEIMFLLQCRTIKFAHCIVTGTRNYNHFPLFYPTPVFSSNKAMWSTILKNTLFSGHALYCS